MWFNPAELAKTKPCTPATLATLATFPQGKEVVQAKVAEVAKVATLCNLKTAIQTGNDTEIDVDNLACFAWLIHYADRDSQTVSFSPMATHAEVLAYWPGAVAAEPLPELSRRSVTNDEASTLQQLIESVYRDDTDDDRNEALQAALADPDNALACYKAMADERGLTLASDDDRRTCRGCANLNSGICSVASPGGAVSAPVGYRPAPDLLQRCAEFNARG